MSTESFTPPPLSEQPPGSGAGRLYLLTWALGSAGSDLVGQNEGLGHVFHRLAVVHTHFLDLAEGLGLAESLLVHQDTLGLCDQLTRLQRRLKIQNLLLQFLKLSETGQRHLDGRREIFLAVGFDKVSRHPGLACTVNQVALAVRAEQHHRRDALFGQDLGCFDAVHVRHLDVHDDDVGAQLARLVDRAAAIRHFAHYQVAQIGEHLPQVHADQRLVVGHNNSCSLHRITLLEVRRKPSTTTLRLYPASGATTNLGNCTAAKTPASWLASVSLPWRSSCT